VLSGQRSRSMSGTTLAASRILTGPASQYILYWSASIGHPARSPLIRPATRRFKVRTGSYTPSRVSTVVHAVRVKSPTVRVVFTAHLSAEDGVPPGALFRKKSECRRCMDAPPARSRSGGILAEGSPQGRIGMGSKHHPTC
jgi:hypothetical protein